MKLVLGSIDKNITVLHGLEVMSSNPGLCETQGL